MKKLSSYLLLLPALCLAVLASCQDNFVVPDNVIGEGEAALEARVIFKDLNPALNGVSRAPGNAIEGINNVIVLAYNEDDELVVMENVTTFTGKSDQNENPDKEHPETSETTTHAVTFNMSQKIPYGKYRIYCVANMDPKVLTDGGVTIGSPSATLRDIKVQWNKDKISANNQCFGFFTSQGKTLAYESKGVDEDFTAPTVIINTSTASLSAWVRRLASKVTVSFDSSRLYEGVVIYLKSVTVKDIAKECSLGQPNTPDNADQLEDGETMYYYDPVKYPNPTLADYKSGNWEAYLTNAHSFGSDHKGSSPALFFYENNQGKGESKLQDADGDFKVDSPESYKPGADHYKDNKPYGTYIEVEAYYTSTNTGSSISPGRIIYRFMLGKNITDNYDALRNHHFKLTMVLQGYGNDPDWHIEYEPTPGINSPSPYYISYLYDEELLYPLQVNGMPAGSYLKAEIIENEWHPEGQQAITDQQYYTGNLFNPGPWNGFLSLRETTDVVVDGTLEAGNKSYYETKKRGIRYYNSTPGTFETGPDIGGNNSVASSGKYSVRDIAGGKMYGIPLYTRAMRLITTTGYTGNNPYFSYRRKAKILFSVVDNNGSILTDSKGNEIKTEAVIYQVRRILNPKGIWRKHNSTEGFHVQLLRLETAYQTNLDDYTGEFKSFDSEEGPWSAIIEKGGWFTISKDGRSVTNVGDSIVGSVLTPIEFDYKPNNTIGENETRHGIILVKYHNRSCYHRIFVRQGYADTELAGRIWKTTNNIGLNRYADSPLDEGARFRYQAWDYPIDVYNDFQPGMTFGENASLHRFVLRDGHTLNTSKTALWSDMVRSDDTNKGGRLFKSGWDFEGPSGNAVKVHVAFNYDYAALRDGGMHYGWGVLYADGSTKVQTKPADAYGYVYYDPKSANGETKGMRGCFVYDPNDATQIFFPIGAQGYGRRKAGRGSATITVGERNSYNGVLRYANRNNFMKYGDPNTQAGNNPAYRPLFWDLFRRPGAVYWCQGRDQTGSFDSFSNNRTGWDFNFFTFDFGDFTNNLLGEGSNRANSDATYIRTVIVK